MIDQNIQIYWNLEIGYVPENIWSDETIYRCNVNCFVTLMVDTSFRSAYGFCVVTQKENVLSIQTTPHHQAQRCSSYRRRLRPGHGIRILCSNTLYSIQLQS